MTPKSTFDEKTEFIKDITEMGSDEEKNSRLSELLKGDWIDYSVVRIERIEIGSAKGWKVTYRE